MHSIPILERLGECLLVNLFSKIEFGIAILRLRQKAVMVSKHWLTACLSLNTVPYIRS